MSMLCLKTHAVANVRVLRCDGNWRFFGRHVPTHSTLKDLSPDSSQCVSFSESIPLTKQQCTKSQLTSDGNNYRKRQLEYASITALVLVLVSVTHYSNSLSPIHYTSVSILPNSRFHSAAQESRAIHRSSCMYSFTTGSQSNHIGLSWSQQQESEF